MFRIYVDDTCGTYSIRCGSYESLCDYRDFMRRGGMWNFVYKIEIIGN